jgi:hypothetical protein
VLATVRGRHGESARLVTRSNVVLRTAFAHLGLLARIAPLSRITVLSGHKSARAALKSLNVQCSKVPGLKVINRTKRFAAAR